MVFKHLPVMPEEVIKFLACRHGKIYVDGTVGGGGHTSLILNSCQSHRSASMPEDNFQNKAIGGKVIGMDWDEDAMKAAVKRFKDYSDRLTLVRENFADIKEVMRDLNIKEVGGILLDLGVSSYHFEQPDRGFSFRLDAPLDMRMDKRQTLTAYNIVNERSIKELEKIILEAQLFLVKVPPVMDICLMPLEFLD